MQSDPVQSGCSHLASNPVQFINISGLKSNSFTDYVPLTILMLTCNRGRTRIAKSL